jgi:hypothetical protein
MLNMTLGIESKILVKCKLNMSPEQKDDKKQNVWGGGGGIWVEVKWRRGRSKEFGYYLVENGGECNGKKEKGND